MIWSTAVAIGRPSHFPRRSLHPLPPAAVTRADEIAKIKEKAFTDELAAEQAAKRAFDSTYYEAIIDTAKGSVSRARSSGELVEKAASAIGALSAAVIGVAR